MERALCEFNSEGVAAFQELMDVERGKVKSSQPAKVSEDFFSMVEKIAGVSTLVQEVPEADPIDDSKVFDSRYDFGHYLHQTLPSELFKVQYSNVGLWAWISAVYLPQLLKRSSRGNSHDLWSTYRYIPLAYSKFRYYRHLAFISFWLHRQLGETAARLFLSRPMYEHSDAIEQLYTSDKDFLTTPALLEVSVEMYLDAESGTMKKKALGKETPGSARRLATKVAKQLQMNFDMHSMTKEQVYTLLPAEFDAWRN
ncbi:hypothetical protein [Pseudosulfitobacter pseudonitzschiae]|uniref:hypothetical protein n=1 Tax=Pseudosulfitobacter pseudonitzschiae TaxID=1402135 RepID=UPI001AF041C5|nr:hypothetical protein [Pseudosulfitobacter pseudonitzschiae]MBM1817964.1 hypothetical protein [Pseudosulfitobacter pseudonitzschiae]MBM1835022.1 hypothetical protein [Pseudosulfitobacter pseudonitzschiae]MBM1839823.1 hypothetical protein [Pseudosulfitobacter pseudonitzschiae]MBM1844761.1 hypothetical protein [Pseudosulfitobacter pseudonitzschiae]MBM1849564.1 hypothetical protein [Pseudosulfitobacter pseudonitzschiae]